MKTILLLACLTLCARADFTPTSGYEERNIEGWTVKVNKALLADAPLSTKVLDLLRVKLFEVQRVLPEQALKPLKKVAIWMELEDKRVPGGVYHPSKQWLIDHDYNPDLAKSIQFGNAKNFLSWSFTQPAMVLHELAHAYHHQVLGYDQPDIKAAFKAARDAGKYEQVLYAQGGKKKHYALNNDQEYFAEATEAYFAVNDFYPFVRAELKEFDPQMHEVLIKVWSVAAKR